MTESPKNALDQMLDRPSPWLSGEGPFSEMVLSTRIRLARNLESVPFTHRAREEQLLGVLAASRTPRSARARCATA